MEDSATDVPVEDSTINIPKKDLATSAIPGRSRLLLMEKPKPVVKVEEVEVNGKIVFNREGRREVTEDVLPKDGDM